MVEPAQAPLQQALLGMLDASHPGITAGSHWSCDMAAHFRDTLSRAHALLDETARNAAAELNARNPIMRLPAEILCIIFQHYVDDICCDAQDILPVCRHWRQTALAHTALWTTIDCNLSRKVNLPDSLALLSSRLSRTKNALVDLSMTCTSRRLELPPELDASNEPLQAHMARIRSMKVNGYPGTLLRVWRIAFTMPAIQLRTLTLNITRAADFPDDMFSGCAPRLEELALIGGIGLPPYAWPPLRGLKRFTYHGIREALDVHALVLVLRACTSLAYVSLEIPKFQDITPPHQSAPATQLAPHEMRLHSSKLTPRLLDEIVRFPWVTMPDHIEATEGDFGSVQAWLSASIVPYSLTIRPISALSLYNQHAISISARDMDGHTRTLHAGASTSLLSFQSYLPHLTELTINEHCWPTLDHWPSLPGLTRLTVELQEPGRAAKKTIPRTMEMGIFLLAIRPQCAWRFARLSTLELAYRPSIPAGQHDVARYVVSAHEICLFLRWHLQSQQALQLLLHNVELLEGPSQPVRTTLDVILRNSWAWAASLIG